MQGDRNELVYAIDLSGWFLIGEHRSFSVQDDGSVLELERDGAGDELTLDDFDLDHGQVSRCPDCLQFRDWTHEDCPAHSY